MARKQTAILSVTRGVTTLNGLVVDRPWGEDPHQAGIRAVREQLAGPSRKPVQVVATDDEARVRMVVHPDGQVTDVETLEVFGSYGSPDDVPGAAWLPTAIAPVVVQAEVEPEPEPEPEPAPAPEPKPEPVSEPEPAPMPPPMPPSAPPPAPAPLPEPEPEPEPDPEPEAVAEPAPERSAGPLVPLHHMEPGPYRRSRMTRRGKVVLVVACVLLLILIYQVVRGVVNGSDSSDTKEPQGQQSEPTAGASDDVIEPPSASPSPSATASSVRVEPTPTPTPKPTPKPTKKPAPEPTRTLSVKAIAMTEAIGLRIDASRLPVTATIAMDPWGAPERFTRTVTITEPNQLVVVKPVASGHAEWSVRVEGAAKVTGYTHSWPKGEREFQPR